MDLQKAKRIVEALSDGVDPRTGDVLTPGSPIESPEVIRALQVALRSITYEIQLTERRKSLPDNAGKSWNAKDDRELCELFDAGRTVSDIARRFQRTRGSIASRLVMLGKTPDRQSAFVANHHSSAAGAQ